MAGYANILVLIAVIAVGLVLFAGLFNMARGGVDAPARSQTLMRWRVGLQFLAVLLIAALLFIRGH